jgi:site-specific DNA recombinase
MLQNPAYMGRAAFGKTHAGDPLPRVRPARHSAETPKKSASSVRTERAAWIAIAVPALISEALFVAVQEQLEENRKLARQRRRGASYLLQGLIVCGHCHYAYYGKKVSKRAAKGRQQYAYYRCIGTDAYRFGGERMCDNKQVRTSQLDDLVWQQVVALLQHPERLRQEYEQRLQRLEQDHRSNADTAGLEKHKRHLQQGQSRLIDGYTEGLIDKADFDPKMAQLKIKLEQVQAQIEASQRQHAGQVELFLVINRLEEFAAAVSDRLTTLEFNTKREIIRALVKRIEIRHEEIVVVFRVDPDPDPEIGNDIGNGKNEPGKTDGTSSMQDCKRRNDPALRCPGLGMEHRSVGVEYPGLEPFADQPEKGLIVDPLAEHVEHPVVVHVLEETPDVGLHHVVVAAVLELVRKRDHRLLGAAVRPVAVAAVEEILLVDRAQQLGAGQLHQFVFQRRDAQRSLFSVLFGNVDASDQLGPVAPRLHALG